MNHEEGERKKKFEGEALKYMGPLYGIALRMTRNESDAEDLVQDAYLRAFKYFNTFTKDISCKAWLIKILKNLYINRYHVQTRTPEMVEISNIEVTDGITPETEVIDELLDDDITNALEALPEQYRLPITLRDVGGFSYKKIAEAIPCPLGTVMSRIHRGRAILKETLEEYAKCYGYIGRKTASNEMYE